MVHDILLSTLRLSVPILFAAFGGMLSERSGVANIALEAVLLFAAFAAAAATSLTGNLWLGSCCGLLAAALISAVFAASCVWGRGDQIVIGTAFNLLAVGVIPVVCKALFNVTGSTPALSKELTFHESEIFFLLALIMLGACIYLFSRPRPVHPRCTFGRLH